MGPEGKIVAGIFFLLLGLGYLHKPRLIQRLHAFIREHLLNDAHMSLERRKWGMFFLLLSWLFLYMGYTAMRSG